MRRRKPKPLRLMPPATAIDRARAKPAAGGHFFPPDAQRLYRIRDLMLSGTDEPVRVIGSVGSDGEILDRNGDPVLAVRTEELLPDGIWITYQNERWNLTPPPDRGGTA